MKSNFSYSLERTSTEVSNNEDQAIPESILKGWINKIINYLFINDYHKMLRQQICINKEDIYYLTIPQEFASGDIRIIK